MKFVLAWIVFASFVKAGEGIDDEIKTFDKEKSFVHHLANIELESDGIVKDCLNVSLDVPQALGFDGSQYLLKILRAAYFYDLKSQKPAFERENSVFQLAFASASKDFENEALSFVGGGLPQAKKLQKQASKKYEIDKTTIYKKVIGKFSDNCVAPKKVDKFFTEKDFEDLTDRTGYSEMCPIKLNAIMERVIDGFNDILSLKTDDLELYVDSLKLLFALNAKEYGLGDEGSNIFMIRFLLLNELIIVKMKSNSVVFIEDYIPKMKLFASRIRTAASTYLRKRLDESMLNDALFELRILQIVSLQTDYDEEMPQEKEAKEILPKIIEDLLTKLDIRNQNLLI